MNDALILIADDSREICRFLQENVLEPAGYRVQAVGEGRLAMEMVRELKPQLVISDHQMPGLTGIELIKKLHRESPSLPVILITGEGSEELAVEALRAGARDYLIKPFESKQLLSSIERILGDSRFGPEGQGRQGCDSGLQELERRIKELETLAQVGRTVTASLDLDHVLAAVVDAATKLTGAEEGSLLLLDEESGELYMRASKNLDQDLARTLRLRVNDSLAGQVVKSGEPVMFDGGSLKKIKTAYLVQSLIYVPLKVKSATIGVLGVDNRTAGGSLTRENMSLLEALADYAGIAIENAQLYGELNEARSKLETVLTQTESGVVVIDESKRLLMINPMASQILGAHEVAIGRPVVDVFDNRDLLALVSAPGALPRREEIEVRDGRIFNAQRTKIDAVGQVIVMHDITRLKELDKAKSDFVTTVSHDLRSPLTAILGYIQLIERAGEINEVQQGFLRQVQASVSRITSLVGDLLDLGRLEAGLDLGRETISLSLLLEQAIGSMRSAAEASGLIIEADLQGERILVNGDPLRLRQMIDNLLDNAIKYTIPGGTVRVETETDENQIILRVCDTGPGIPPADQPYLFDKFFRGSNIVEGQVGSGLGLSIVKSIVENHGGRIWVESLPEKGTTFTVVLPGKIE